MARKKILLVGSANMDFSMNVYRVPEAGETLLDDGGVAYTPGGKGANSAIAFHKLGAECVFCTKLGADAHGQKLYNYYKEMGINTSYIKVDHDHPTGLSVVIKEADGQNRIVVEMPFSVALSTAKIAAARNIPIFIDPAPANKDFALDNLPPVEVFSPNETETFEYTGIMPTTMETSLRACLAISRRVKCKYIVLKQGQRGAFLYDGKRYSTFPAARVDKVVDTTAAGDAFTAALTLEYLRCGDIREAVKYANVAGALTVTRPGASTSIPTEEEVRAHIAAQ